MKLEKRDRPTDEFFKFYQSPEVGKTTPHLGKSLEIFRKICPPHILPKSELMILLEGYSCGRNLEFLIEFLREYGIQEYSITVIDVDSRGWYTTPREMQEKARFLQVNAIDLPFQNEEFHIVIQDFLLNCAPHYEHSSILREAHRVLKPEGLFFLSYSTLIHPPQSYLEGEEYQVFDQERIVAVEGEQSLLERWIKIGEDKFIFVTPTGDLEFPPTPQVEKELLRFFEVIASAEEVGTDRSGMSWLRHRTILRKKII